MGENNLTSEYDENNPKTVTDGGRSHLGSTNNLLGGTAKLGSGSEEIDFEGITNPSILKTSPNDMGAFEDLATKPVTPTGTTGKGAVITKAKNASEEAIMIAII